MSLMLLGKLGGVIREGEMEDGEDASFGDREERDVILLKGHVLTR